MRIEDVKFTAMNMYKYIQRNPSLYLSLLTLVRVFPLSMNGPNSISRAKAHMIYMGRKLALQITLYHSICSNISTTGPTFAKKNATLPCTGTFQALAAILD